MPISICITVPSWPVPVVRRRMALALWAAMAAADASGASAPVPPACEARSGPRVPRVIELYTSEGCSSCPPADRWLAALKPGADTLALAFHVDYWDALGWKDRFASAAHSARQRQWQVATGARFVYTPQVLLDGADWRGWPAALPSRADATGRGDAPQVHLVRSGNEVSATVTPPEPAPAAAEQYSAYWALLEDGHQTAVKAGENRGEVLRHDHVVVRYQPVPAWPAGQAQDLRLVLDASAPAVGPARQLVFVVESPRTRQAVQAVRLACDAAPSR